MNENTRLTVVSVIVALMCSFCVGTIYTIVTHKLTKAEVEVEVVNVDEDKVEKETTENLLYKIAEKAYYEGQVDALTGDIRITLNNDSIYVWNKSPWDSGKKPIFDPK
jgi:hypothetical protein